MKKRISFKIIELPTHQVLVSKDFDENDNNKHLVVLTFELNGLRIDAKMGYLNKKDRDKYFNKVDEKTAQVFLDDFLKMTK